MNKSKIIYGLLSTLVGYTVFILLIDIYTKPTDIGISLKPIGSLEAYFFGFVWAMGDIGWLVGGLLLISFLALFYFLGMWIHKNCVALSASQKK
ncbi:MAG: hypothetical protein N4A59_10795 [Marinifilum sp.]|jgi:hypothetical protein|nr:hypothetical protein [Marinifilum sp.]